jgi:hypothetical protein
MDVCRQVAKLVVTAGVAAVLVVGAGLGLGLGSGPAASAQARAATAPSVRRLASPAAFSGVSCKGGSFCLATGSYSKTGHPDLPLLEEWNGKTWRIMPEPPGTLFSITCGAPSFCLAATQPARSGARTVVWNGRTWRTFKHQPPDIYSVSCETPTFCVTFGSGLDIVDWNGKDWQSMPGAENGCGGPDCGYDNDLSCSSATDCRVTGSYCDDDDCNGTSDFSQTWNGVSWVASAGSPFAGSEVCTGHSFCMDLALPSKAAITRDWGNTWHDASAGLAAACRRAGNCSSFPNQSCGSPWFCVALPSAYSTAALTWSGARWRTAPVARVSGHLPKLTVLSCGSPRNCVAIGSYQVSPRSNPRLISEHWNGSKWQITQMRTP